MIKLLSTQSILAAALLVSAAPLALADTDSDATTDNSSSAQSQSQQPVQNPTTTQSQAWQQSAQMTAPPAADIKPFESAKLSLTQAIAAAQTEMRGQTIEARFELWHGKPMYLVRTYAANQVWEGRIDANTGLPIGQPRAISADQLGPQLRNDVAALQNAQTSLTQAVSNAEQQKGGNAIMVTVEVSPNGTATYDLDLVKDGHLHTAMIDTQSGQLR